MGLTLLEKIIPGTRWLRGYTTQFAIADIIAGLTVSLTVLPQGLAYATLAGLEPQYGLYSCFIGGFVYACIGGCRELTIGPTALLSLMTSRHTKLGGVSGPHLAILLCFLSGLVELVMGFLRLGVLVELISMPVTVGFTSATAIIIAVSQLKGLLGITVKSVNDTFIGTLQTVFSNFDTIRWTDATLGLTSLALLLLIRRLKDIKLTGFMGGVSWFIALSRNAMLVFVSSLAAYFAYQAGKQPFILTGTVKSGLPDFALPPFETSYNLNNGTEVHMGFQDMVSELGSSIFLVPIVAVLGNVAISKAFGGSGIDPSTELVALALSNVLGSLFGSYPVTGSFSRSAVNSASGVKTPIGGIFTGLMVLLALGTLAPYFQYIPRAALSAVIISAVIFMIEYEIIPALWRCSRRELLPGAVTFILSLWLGVEIGLLAGVAADVGFLVHRAARPTLYVEKLETRRQIEVIMVRPKYSLLYFPAIEYVRSQIGIAMKKYGTLPVVLDCSNISEFDYTAAKGLGQLNKELSNTKTPFILLDPSPEVKSILQVNSSTIPQVDGEDELENLLLGTEDCEIKIKLV